MLLSFYWRVAAGLGAVVVLVEKLRPEAAWVVKVLPLNSVLNSVLKSEEVVAVPLNSVENSVLNSMFWTMPIL